MADSSIPITAGVGTPIRVLTALGSGVAGQQVMTLADSAGNLLGGTGAPFPVGSVADTATTGTMAAANATVAIATGGRGTTAIELTGTWAGTISFQATSDPSGTAAVTANWYPVNAPAPTVTVPTSSTTANGLYRVNSSGYTAVRVIMSAYTSGTATAWINAAAQSSMVTLAEPVTSGADPDTTATGTLTTTDAVVAAPAGDGALRTGTPTAGSTIQVMCPGGDSSWDLQLTGTFGAGTVYFEGSFDGGTNWINLNGRQTGVVNTVVAYSATTAGLYRGNTSGTTHIRARIVGATTPSVGVLLRVASGVGAVFMNASIPAGTNNIGVAALPPSTLVVSSSAAATAGTATLPAAGAGLFHYITNIRIERTTTAATTGAASSFVTGGTNHALVFQLPSDTQAIGYQSVPVDYRPTTPLKVTAANTATTVTTPAVTATTYRTTITYYTAA